MKVDTRQRLLHERRRPGIVRSRRQPGTLLGFLNLEIVGGEPKRQICATNVAFGDRTARASYGTACDASYRIR
jgi:hypothetical protein